MIVVFQRELLDWLLPIWHLPPELTCDGIKSEVAKRDFCFVKKLNTRENCVENLLSFSSVSNFLSGAG